DYFLECVRRVIGKERLNLFRCRRKADQVEIRSPDKHQFVSLGIWFEILFLELCQDESVNWSAHPAFAFDRRNVGLPDLLESPELSLCVSTLVPRGRRLNGPPEYKTRIPLGAVVDPGLQNRDFFIAQLASERHPRLLLPRYVFVEIARGGIAGNNGGTVLAAR